MTDRVGQQLGNYRLISLLGQGGFADVYLGEHYYLGTQAAIKILHTRLLSGDIEAFRSESRTIASLEHPHIVQILDFGVENSLPYLVMDYASNGTLRQIHPKGTHLPLEKIISYIEQIAGALQYAHSQKLIHRDVKPENMLVGQNKEILLSDFGIAVLAQSSRYQTTQEAAGTIYYMAPEQIQGKPRPASDQYALGVVVYEWLCGERPFQGSFTEVAAQHLYATPPHLHEKIPSLLPGIEEVVMKALAKDSQKRFENIQAFAEALKNADKTGLPDIPSSTIISPQIHFAPTLPMLISESPGTSVSAILPTIPGTSNSYKPSTWSNSLFSRRTVVVGIAGLVVAGGAIAWLIRSHSSPQPKVGSSPTIPSKSVPTYPPTATPSPTTFGTTLLTYTGHANSVNSVAWSPDGRHIASGSRDTTAQIWDSTSGNKVHICHGSPFEIRNVAWSPDGAKFAFAATDSSSAHGNAQIWNAITGNPIFTYHGHIYGVLSVAWSFTGQRIVSGSFDTTAQVWDATTGNIYSQHPNASYVFSVAWSLDGKRITSASAGNVPIWDATTGNTLVTCASSLRYKFSVAWSPDGSRIASGSDDHTVHVWDSSTGNTLLTYSGHSASVDSVAWSPDSTRIASGSFDNTVQIWDATTGKLIYTYLGHSQGVNSVAWSPDGKRIASGSNDNSVQVWLAE